MVRAIVVPPGSEAPRLVELDAQLESCQTLVDGFIELLTVRDLAFVLDEEGKIKNKPINYRTPAYLYQVAPQWIGRDAPVGVVLIVGSGDEFADAPAEAVAYFVLD